MLEYEVHNRAEFAAAVKAAAQPSFKEARDNPVSIKCGTTQFNFKEGISEARATELLGRIKATTAKAFEIK